MIEEPIIGLCRLVQFSLTTAKLFALRAFYESALGFHCLARQRHSGSEFERLMGVAGGAIGITLMLGDERLELLEFDHPGAPYPAGSTAADLDFQHLALVTSDMQMAYRQLLGVDGWEAISTHGPQQLPDSSGGVTAFKFRDPEGHPLELLEFAKGRAPSRWATACKDTPCLGIDHSAISVRDTARSVAFYRKLGLHLSQQTRNSGLAQQRLDGLLDADVEVSALELSAGPHVELLGYRNAKSAATPSASQRDVAASRMVFERKLSQAIDSSGITSLSVLDPDGHHLLIVAPA